MTETTTVLADAQISLGTRLVGALRSKTILVMTAFVALVLTSEVSRLISSIAVNDRTYSLSDNISPLAFMHEDTWAAWNSIHGLAARQLDAFLVAAVVIDFVLIAAYSRAFWRFVLPDLTSARILLLIAIASDVLENLLLLGWAAGPLHDVGWFPPVAAAASTAKWVGWIVLAFWILQNDGIRPRLWGWLKKLALGLWIQRLPALPVIVFVALGTASGWALFEQFPDIERTWFSDGAGVSSMFDSILAFGFVSVALLFIARQRAEFVTTAARTGAANTTGRPNASWWPWLVIAAAVPAMAGIFYLSGNGQFIDWSVAKPFVIVPLGLVALSAVFMVPGIRHAVRTPSGVERPDPFFFRAPFIAANDPLNRDRARISTALGDTISALFLALLFISMTRAYLGPALLSEAQPERTSSPYSSLSWLVVGFGFVLGVVTVPVARALLDWIVARWSSAPVGTPGGVVATLLSTEHPSDSSSVSAAGGTPTSTQKAVDVFRAIAAAVAVGYIVFAVALPNFAEGGGITASLAMLVGCWTVALAVFAGWLGRRRPLLVFRAMRLRTDPLMVILLLLPLILSLLVTDDGGPATMHAIKITARSSDAESRPSIQEIVGDWQKDTATCAVPIHLGENPQTTDPRVRPLVIAAAEGGGIRAAEWTVDVLGKFAPSNGDCASKAILLSSGVSGGAVGLALTHTTTDTKKISTIGLGNQSTLAAAVTGLLARDIIGSTTGIRVPTNLNGTEVWEDRAALIERGWREYAPQLTAPFDSNRVGPAGYIILNSTAIGITCKVTVSQIELDPVLAEKAPTDAAKNTNSKQNLSSSDCNRDHGALSRTIDFFDYYRECNPTMDWATAALLAARFPVVTPGGRVSPSIMGNDISQKCKQLSDLELGDGGDFENSGLGTLSDVAPQLVAAIAAINADADGQSKPFVIPVVMFISNEPRHDIVSAPQPLQREVLLPVGTLLSATSAQANAETFLKRISDTLSDVCPQVTPMPAPSSAAVPAPGESHELNNVDCTTAVSWFRTHNVPSGAVLVAPATNPGIEVPLGWVLSDASRKLLVCEADKQSKSIPKPGNVSSHYASLGNLLSVIAPKILEQPNLCTKPEKIPEPAVSPVPVN